MSKHLQNYFDAAKQQAPLLTEKEVANLLNTSPKVVVKKRFLNLKRFVFMSTLSVMITAIWLMWNNQNVSTIKPQATISMKQVAPTQPQPNNTNGLIEKPVLNRLQLSPTKPQQVTPDSLSKPQAPNEVTNWFEPKNSNSYIEPQEPTREYFNKNGELMLTHEELAKLGIITDGNVLSYENVVDTSSKWITPMVAGMSDTGFYSFKLLVSEKGSKFTHRSINRTEIKLKSKSFWPAVIETETERDTSYNVVEYISDRQNTNKIFFNEIKPFCIPVRIEFVTQLKHTSYIFWFKAQQSFINELPVKAAVLLQPKVDQVDIREYHKILDSYSTLKSWTKLKDLLGEKKIDQLQKNIIKLDKEGYQKLKISKTINSFKYVNNIYEDQTKRRLIISSKRKQQYIEIGTPKYNITPKDTLIQVVALTNKSFDYSMFFYLNNNALSQSKTLELNTKRFAKECDELIPIQVTSNMVLWFRPTEYLKNVIKQYNSNP